MEISTDISKSINLAKKKSKRKRALLPWLLLSPTILLLLLVVGGPIIGTIGLSFTNWNGIAPAEFTGVQNFVQLLQDQVFFKALLNNFKWMIFFLTVPVIVGLSIALLISRVKHGRMFYR